MQKVLLLLFLFIAVTLTAEHLFVVNSISQVLSDVDLITGQIDLNYCQLGLYPNNAAKEIAFYEHYALITITYENMVQKIDLNNPGDFSCIYLEDSSLPSDILVNGNYAYVTGNGSGKVYKINLLTNQVMNQVYSGISPEGIAFSNGRLFVTNTGFNLSDYSYAPGTVTVINAENMQVEQTLNTALNPRSLVVVENELHVVCTGDYFANMGRISIFSLNDFSFIEEMNIGNCPSASAYANGKVFLGNAYPLGIYVYNVASRVIEIFPDDNIMQGGESISVYGNSVIITDPSDYVSTSVVRIYDSYSYVLTDEYQVAIGSTDAKVYQPQTGIEEQSVESCGNLTSCYPNPIILTRNTKSNLNISYSLKEDAAVTIDLYDLKGRKLAVLLNNYQDKGEHVLNWNKQIGNLSSGVIFCILNVNGRIADTRRIVVIK